MDQVGIWVKRLVALVALAGCASTATPPPPPVAPAAATPAAAPAGATTETPVEDLTPALRRAPELVPLLDDAERRRIQILVSLESKGQPLRRFGFRLDAEYFYPASAVKLCTAVAAAEKLQELRATYAELSLTSPLKITDSTQRPAVVDTTLKQELEKSLVVSDNDAYNHLFDFVGRDDLNQRMARMGLRSTRLAHRFGPNPDRDAPQIEFGSGGRVLYIGQRLGPPAPPPPIKGVLVGTSHVDANGRVVNEPFDFAEKNRISIRDLQDLLIAVVRPDLAGPGRTAALAPADRQAIIDILGKTPNELYPGRSARIDDLHNPIRAAVTGALPRHELRTHEKGGRAYGFAVANAYVEDKTTSRAIFVTAVIHASDNGRINDDRYEYQSVADPFIARLGAHVARTFLAADSFY